MDKKQRFWFLTNQEMVSYLLFRLIEIVLLTINTTLYLHFLRIQKLVQSGQVIQNWNRFIFISIALAFITAIVGIFQKFYGMKMTMFLRFNLFRRYRKFFQVYEKAIKLKGDLVGDIFGCIDLAIRLSFNLFLVFKTTSMVEFSKQTTACAIILLILATIFGVLRGFKRAEIAQVDGTIRKKEGDLTKFYTFSRNFLENALYVLRIESDSRTRANVITEILTKLPTVVKEIMIAISVYGLVSTLAEGVVYSNAYIVMTAFGVVLSIAESLSSILENIFGCIKISLDSDVKELNAFENKEKHVLSKAKKCVTANNKSVTIASNFTADLSTPAGVKYYFLRQNLHINIGENILLIGQKGTGKTRFLQLLESMDEGKVMIYNDRTTVFSKFYDNFKSDIGWNYELIQELAKGLKLYRFLLPEDELKKLDMRSINTGDLHLLAALIMLYYAISKPTEARVIIMDELLANVDKQNAEEILKFVVDKGKEINATIIFVGHSQQDMIEKYCTTKWQMTSNEATVFIEERTI
ncbi:MAG: hypothetical protein IJ629_05630 [Clostridia bacterium]|nr:hypothetical protein [Clostridia bacterium]